MDGFGEAIVGKRLVHLDGFSGANEFVNIGRHCASAWLAVERFEC